MRLDCAGDIYTIADKLCAPVTPWAPVTSSRHLNQAEGCQMSDVQWPSPELARSSASKYKLGGSQIADGGLGSDMKPVLL